MNFKKTTLYLLSLFLLLSIIFFYLVKGLVSESRDFFPLPDIKDELVIEGLNLPSVDFQDKIYAYVLFRVDDLTRLHLIINKDWLSSEALAKEHGCKELINAGFYDKENQPLGYFLSEGDEISPVRESELFNGYFLVDEGNQIVISRSLDKVSCRIGLQSGPILIEAGAQIDLQIKDDQEARRMAAVVTRDQELIFLTIFFKNSQYHGPTLIHTPAILELIAENEDLEFEQALNLDGGAASCFKSGGVFLKEYRPIGSLFCLK